MSLLAVFMRKVQRIAEKRSGYQLFCLGAVVTVRITENSPVIKILYEEELMVRQECLPESVQKIISLS